MTSGHLILLSHFPTSVIRLIAFSLSPVRKFERVLALSFVLIGTIAVSLIWLSPLRAESPPAPTPAQTNAGQDVSNGPKNTEGSAPLGKPPDVHDILLQASKAADDIDNDTLDKPRASIESTDWGQVLQYYSGRA
jgi:hypothetical protein